MLLSSHCFHFLYPLLFFFLFLSLSTILLPVQFLFSLSPLLFLTTRLLSPLDTFNAYLPNTGPILSLTSPHIPLFSFYHFLSFSVCLRFSSFFGKPYLDYFQFLPFLIHFSSSITAALHAQHSVPPPPPPPFLPLYLLAFIPSLHGVPSVFPYSFDLPST